MKTASKPLYVDHSVIELLSDEGEYPARFVFIERDTKKTVYVVLRRETLKQLAKAYLEISR